MQEYEHELTVLTLPKSTSARITGYTWGMNGNIFVGDSLGSLHVYSSRTGSLSHTIPYPKTPVEGASTGSKVVGAFIIQSHVIVAHEDSATYWYAKGENGTPYGQPAQEAFIGVEEKVRRDKARREKSGDGRHLRNPPHHPPPPSPFLASSRRSAPLPTPRTLLTSC